MPTVLIIKGHRFFFYSLEGNEPAHIHVECDGKVGKFWLDPVNLASSYGFRSHELTEIRSLVIQYKVLFLEKWNEHFSN